MAALSEVKAILKSLVISSPEKVTVAQLKRDYSVVEGTNIPFQQLGYENLEKFLHSIPDTLRVFGSGENATVCFVSNKKSGHIHDMIMAQKRNNSRSRPSSHGFHSKITNNNKQPHKVVGQQQLSSHRNINRNGRNQNVKIMDTYYPKQNIKSSTSVICNSSQPNGTFSNSQVYFTTNSIHNGVIKPSIRRNQISEDEISDIKNLVEKQCTVSSSQPPSQPRSEYKSESVRFPVQGARYIEKELSKEESTCKKPDTAVRTQHRIDLPDEKECPLNMPKLTEISNLRNNANLTPNIEETAESICSLKAIKSTHPKTFFEEPEEVFDYTDEAVPSFAAKNNVFRLDFPNHFASYGTKIPSYKLPDGIIVGSCIKVFISEIHNPFRFWFHIHKDDHELDSLMHRIERYYSVLDSEDLRIPTICLVPGQLCAACFNGLWHRAEVVATPVNKTVKVFFTDYGTVSEVDTENIKFLHSYFTKLPAQALRGCLSHIKPREFHWSHEATTYFLTLVAELLLYAKISEIDKKKNVFYVILCDTNGEEVNQINTCLVEKRYACYDQNWKTEKIKQNNGIRIRHPREDFPTFSMIESGEYPNFSELLYLQQYGIDYETIHDVIIYNQSIILNKHESVSDALRNLPYFLTTSNPFRSEIVSQLYDKFPKII